MTNNLDFTLEFKIWTKKRKKKKKTCHQLLFIL